MRQSHRRSSGLIALIVALATTLDTCSVSAAQGVLDQSTGEQCCIAGIVQNGGQEYMLGESFTAGITGYLDTAALFIYQQEGVSGRYRVRITGTTPDGAPDDVELAAAVLDVCR
jgi:hypothetical protein